MIRPNTLKFEDFLKEDLGGSENRKYISELLIEINEPRFHLKEIKLKPKVLNDWTKAGLFYKNDEKVWRKYSFTEMIWLKFIEELRYFGLTLKEIKTVKDEYHGINPVNIQKAIESYKRNKENNISESIARSYEKLTGNNSEDDTLYNNNVFGPFNQFIIFCICGIANPIFINSKQNMGFFTPGEIAKKNPSSDEKTKQVEKILFTDSHTLIYLRNIIFEFLDNSGPTIEMGFYYSILDKKEMDLIERIRSGNYTKMTISLEEEKIVLTKGIKKNDELMYKKLVQVLRKGEYVDIEFSARDGKIIKLNEIELIK